VFSIEDNAQGDAGRKTAHFREHHVGT